MQSVNEKGFITGRILNERFMTLIMKNLTRFGYENRELGNSESTYTL
jgi:hypothetical protein